MECNRDSLATAFMADRDSAVTQTLADQIETRIRSRTIKQIDQRLRPGEFIYPAYSDLSLVNIPATLLKLFDIRIPHHDAVARRPDRGPD